MKNKIKISETFETIQGEGMFAGAPSLFIRTSGCNLRCWWCDTPYTSWTSEGSTQTVDSLLELARGSKCRHVVITGGEPMMFPREVAELTMLLKLSLGKVVTIETNGTRFDPKVQPNLWSVSPKLESSTPSDAQGARERALHLSNIAAADLSQFAANEEVLGGGCQFKFVVVGSSDLLEVEQFTARHKLHPRQVWLMPEGREKEVILTRGAWLADVCEVKGYNLCLRQHVLLWGNKRGT